MIKLLWHKENRNFQRLWWGQIISQFGDRIHQFALVGLIAERPDSSAMNLAKLLAFTILPVFIIQPFAGTFVDRWNRQTTLFVCDLFRGLLVLTIPFCFIYWHSMVPIYGIVFLIFCFSRFYVPAKMSIIPDLVKADNLLMANSLVSTTGMIAFVLGCAAGGFLVNAYGARNGFIIDAGTFFISGAFVFTIAIPRHLTVNKERLLQSSHEIVDTIKTSIWEDMAEGFKYLIQHREIRFIINILFILLSAAGSVYVVIIVFIQKTFKSVTADLAIMAIFLGAGLFVGAIGYGKWGKKFKWYNTMFGCLILGGIMLLFFTVLAHFYANLYLTMFLAFIMGIVIGPIFIAANTVVHVVSDEKMRGKVFSALEIVIHFAFLVAMFVSSWLSEFIEEYWILSAVSVIFILVGLVGLLRAKKNGLKFAFSPDHVA
ncbi:MAG: MFS transporter [Candidatus Omnitrophica bacterium]|nr:MFS transporter [Candidatus Omnitrophota bacterium]